MLSADISGFTALSERLSDKGKAGAEEITALISKCFEALIGVAYEYGGEVLKFGGDALLVIFRGDDHMRRVAAAAVEMQNALASTAGAKRAKLTMTVGASEGPFDVFMVGTGNRDLLISGDRATKVIELEGTADKGQTLISEAIAEALLEEVPLIQHELGYVIDQVVAATKPGPRPAGGNPDLIQSLIAPSVNRHFEAFEQLGGEHRIVAVDFLSIAGVQAQLDSVGGRATADQLGYLFDTVTEIGERFDVSILHTDIYDDGVKFLMCAGAPHTTGQTGDAILEAALEIQQIRSPFVLKQGIQQGRCFAGFLGSSYRRAYTLMGDIVNTAARMLGPAHDRDIVAVDEVFRTTRTIFITDPLPPVLAKGKAEPIQASLVIAASDETRFRRIDAPLVGRDDQLERFRSLLLDGGAVIQLQGPAGAGKSRLLDAFRAEARERGRSVVSGSCSPYSRSTPYAVLRMLLRERFGIDSFADPETAGDLLLKAIHYNAPELETMAPIAAIPLGASVPATAEADAIDSKFLRPNINKVVASLLRSSVPHDVLLVVEDVHWIDEPSAEFFEFLQNDEAGDIRDWTTVLTTRPENAWSPQLAGREVELIELEPLTADDIRSLALVSTEHDLTDRQLDTVVEQAQGNPLFAIELAKAVGEHSGETVPDTVEQLIGARIDALDPKVRHAMRLASVFGYRLRTDDLRVVLAPEPPPDIDALSEFIVLDEQDNLGFTHALYREVAYEGLPYTERKRLHRRVGEHLEAITPVPESIADVLALHFSEAKDSARTWTYGVMAGDAARRKAATAEAAVHFERALAVSKGTTDATDEEVARIAFALGDAESLLGNLDRAEAAFGKARKRAQDTETEVDAMLRVGNIRENQGRYSDAARWYDRAEALLPPISSTDNQRKTRARVHFFRSGLLHRLNDQQGCIDEARLSLAEAEDANDVPAMAEALQRLHLATIYLGREDHIRYGPTALRLFRDLGKFERQFAVFNNLGIQHYFAGRWTEAAQNYEAATEAGLQAGYVLGAMLGVANRAEILSDQGKWDEALELLESARRNLASGLHPMAAALVLLFSGITQDRKGEIRSAKLSLESAITALTELGLDDQALDAETRLLILQVSDGRSPVESLREHYNTLGADHPLAPRIARAMANRASRGEWAEHRTRLLDLVEGQAGYERALTLRVLAHYDGADADPTWAIEAQEIFDSLGVVRLRPLPDPPD